MRQVGKFNIRWLYAGLGVAVLVIVAFTPVRGVVQSVMTPVQYSLEQTTRSVRGFFVLLGSIKDLSSQNAGLRDKVQQLQATNAQLADVKAENDALRAQLGFAQRAPWPMVAAHVVGRDPSNFIQEVIIDRGTVDGVTVGAPVVVSDSVLVGKIASAESHTARVQLITDPNLQVSVVSQDTKAKGLVKGEHGLGVIMDLITQTEVIKPGDAIATSGLDGAFPSGLLIGTIEAVLSPTSELFQRASLQPAASLDDLNILFVIKPQI